MNTPRDAEPASSEASRVCRVLNLIALGALLFACDGGRSEGRTEALGSGQASSAAPSSPATGSVTSAGGEQSAADGEGAPTGSSAMTDASGSASNDGEPAVASTGNTGSEGPPQASTGAEGQGGMLGAGGAELGDVTQGEGPESIGAGGVAGEPTLGAGGAGTETTPDAGSADTGEEPDERVEELEPAVHFVGRFLERADGARSFEWSGSGVVARFEGEGVSVTLEDTGSNHFTVLVNGELQPTLVANAGVQTYELSSGLGAGPHVVELYRRTEASFGPTTFLGFDFGAGRLLAPTSVSRRIEIIGDSISCGYGNEGESASCGFSADTENHYLTYGAIAARELGAEVVTIAWSGKGIVYNYGTDTNDPLPALYDLILPSSDAAVWDFSTAPDAVVINLGTNDFSTDGDPSAQLFEERYVSLLEHLRSVYPEAYISCTVGPLLGGADLDAARAGIANAVAARLAAGDIAVGSWEMNVSNDAPGCDYHPSVRTHQLMASALTEELGSVLGW